MARAQQDRRKAAFFHKLCCRGHQARPMDGDSVLILNSASALRLCQETTALEASTFVQQWACHKPHAATSGACGL